jgi:ATP/maltotriose-dependent transcriptional regulator MalT
MASSTADVIDAQLHQGNLGAAVRSVVVRPPERAGAEVALRRLGAGVFAIAGLERDIAGQADPYLLDCRTGEQALAFLNGLNGEARAHDYLTAAVILTWSADAGGAYRCFEEARDRGLREERFHVAVAALERFAHYALLFGDLGPSRKAIEDALDLAVKHHLGDWKLRCAARASQLAFESGDLDRAAELLDEGRSARPAPPLLALFAPAGARLALLREDDAALRSWTSADVIDTALHCVAPDAAVAATLACLLGAAGAGPPLGAIPALALRRMLVQVESPSNAVELFSLAARCGTLDEARLAVDSLRAVFAPRRRYIEAHHLLARAHLLMRGGDRPGAMSSAGDAARAFDSIGLRRWTNEAMLLLVHHDGLAEPQSRRRPTALSLTRREEQVAHLISRGASNREVARTLQISEHTVERHVSSILSRLGLRSRWQIVDSRLAPVED